MTKWAALRLADSVDRQQAYQDPAGKWSIIEPTVVQGRPPLLDPHGLPTTAMLQHPEPDDYILATGEGHSVREFVERAFAVVGRPIEWRGNGLDEVGVDAGKVVVAVDPTYFRPTEINALIGSAAKARQVLGWMPRTSFDALVREMVEHDVRQTAGQGRT